MVIALNVEDMGNTRTYKNKNKEHIFFNIVMLSLRIFFRGVMDKRTITCGQ